LARYDWDAELEALKEEIKSMPEPSLPTPTPEPEPEPVAPIEEEQSELDQIFHRYLPDTLYKSHYELSYDHGHTPQEWRKYLRDHSLFIETELAAIAEAEARSALSRLGNASGQEVTALKAVLEKSKLINDAQKQQTRVILTYLPPTERA
jgi:hypothetical protein